MKVQEKTEEELSQELEASFARIRKLESEMAEIATRFRSLFETMTEGFALHEIVCDDEGAPIDFRFLEVNPAFELITGLKRSEVIGKTMRELTYEFPKHLIEVVGSVALTGQPTHFENTFEDRSYDVFAYSPVHGQFAAIFRDITERKQMEERLQEIERNYEGLFHNKSAGIAHCKVVLNDLDEPVNYVHLEVNDTYEAVVGLRKEDVIGKTATQVVPDLSKAVIERVGRVALTGKDERFEVYLPSLKRWLDVNAYSSKKGYFTAIFYNITGRKKMEEALRESERNLAEGQRMGRMGSWQWNVNTRKLTWSDELFRIYGISPAVEPTLEELSKIVHPHDRESFVESIADLDRTGKSYSIDFRIIKDGSNRWIHSEGGATAFDETGKVLQLAGIVQDVTERKMTEEALKEARDEAENERHRLEAVMEALPVGLSIVNEHGRLTLHNSAFRNIWNGAKVGPLPPNFSFDEFHPYVAWWPDTGNRVQPQEWASARAARKGETVVGQVMEIRRFDGAIGFIIKSAAPIRDTTGKIIGAACVAQDITELRRIEDELRENEEKYREITKSLKKTVKEQVEQLRQVESLAAVGRMVSVVAHEIRNPLLNILLGAASLRNMMADNNEALEVLDEINYGADLLRTSVNDLLNYARPIRLENEMTGLGEIIQDALKEMRYKLENIDVEIRLEDEKRTLFLDRSKMKRALINIIQNAAEAMPAGGKLEIGSQTSTQGNLTLAISDTGQGMTAETVRNLFEPFYTTKATGTGLGLSISKKIIEAHSGKISIKSRPGKGTTVKISLPINGENKTEA
ncbi:MAG: PAS domain S-box protein [Candidatus Abyssobacteria bacterium SURF_5]|uniref:histidine kinase n=1 Tax=Abyssobacteria bacterium (strain SURF_5) TaxID=2093360 RepID=A0A3A4NLE0_ABYX5|nr:MAG: PAS domain S-box protein [Candidatus Abyssubacteria bacterium SURF_5]